MRGLAYFLFVLIVAIACGVTLSSLDYLPVSGRLLGSLVGLSCGLIFYGPYIIWRHQLLATNLARIMPVVAELEEVECEVLQPGHLGIEGRAVVGSPPAGLRISGFAGAALAQQAGLAVGDVLGLLAWGEHTSSVLNIPTQEIVDLLASLQAQRPLRITVLRDKSASAAGVGAGAASVDASMERMDASLARVDASIARVDSGSAHVDASPARVVHVHIASPGPLGMSFDSTNTVTEVSPGGLAFSSGVVAGREILAVGGTSVEGMPAPSIVALLVSSPRPLTLTLKVPSVSV